MQVSEPLTYIGPSRRSDKTVIEWPLQLTPHEQEVFRSASARGSQALQIRLDAFGCKIPALDAAGLHVQAAGEGGAVFEVARWVAEIALALQKTAGHRVAFSTVLPGSAADQYRLVYEYEHAGVGQDAGELALRLLSESIPGLEWEANGELPGTNIEDACNEFFARASKHLLPLDAQAIIDAAARLDVPCVKLEREPYGVLEGDFRIRRNGLLKLGHSCYQHIVDGTLCIDRNPELVPLLFDREKLYECMQEFNLPAPRQDREFRNLITAKRAVRAAERVGYPVVLKPANRSRSGEFSFDHIFRSLASEEEVRAAFEQTRKDSQRVIVEQHISGSTFHLLLANHEPLCLIEPAGLPMPPSSVHASILEMAVQVSKSLEVGLLDITFVTTDPERSFVRTGGAIVDLDPAPQLDRLLPAAEDLMARAAEGFVRWLYPPKAACRIPLAAVTGTNGKTTTSRMIARIARTAGFRPGMASTSGVYFNEVLQHKGDLAGSGGHHFLFESRSINLGVLETARGAVAHSGFMFDWCDVAVCLNVTEDADHIGEYGIETLEQMTALKRSVLERARRAVVLNADYTTCRDMLPFPAGINVYMASIESGVAAIRNLAGEQSFACVLEEDDGREWIALYLPDGTRQPVMPVTAIPATLEGAARFNISNAQHAVCACHALGLGLDAIRQGLSSFEAGFENTPGRLNIYRELPFTVVMDFAHNVDGLKKLCDFIDQMEVPGRRILLLDAGFKLDHRNAPLDADIQVPRVISDFARVPVGHFDHFVCHVDPDVDHSNPAEVLALMKTALLRAGVTEEQITIVPENEVGEIQALRLARPGDLVLLTIATDDVNKVWQQIVSFRPAFS